MVKLHHLSTITKRTIMVKMESLNPGGTGKDRAALAMIQAAESNGELPSPCARIQMAPTKTTDMSDTSSIIHMAMLTSRTGGLVVEGTSGSTGISLATLCAARGHACLVVLPDDQANEKKLILTTMGAVVHVVPTASISNPLHYVNVARRTAQRAREEFGIQAVFMNQFENAANYHIHYTTTGPEIYHQCPQLDAFCMSSGTGGTIAGVGTYLTSLKPSVRIVLVDPPGSALYHKITHGIVYTSQQSERSLKRHRYDTLAEGIGLDRMTHNLQLGIGSIRHAIQVSDQEAVDMAHYLLHQEGLWVGSSSSMNVVGAIRTALELPEKATVVTVVCDAGHRHVTRFWNREFIEQWGLVWPGTDGEDRLPECLQSIM
jgi:cysteine synthase